MTDEARIVADFNYGGVAGDDGRVYLPEPVLEDIRAQGTALAVGATLTVSDYDEDEEGNPAWVVVEGTVGHEAGSDRWYLDYKVPDLRYEPRNPADPPSRGDRT